MRPYVLVNKILVGMVDSGLQIESWISEKDKNYSHMIVNVPKDYKFMNDIDKMFNEIEEVIKLFIDPNFEIEYKILDHNL